VLLCVALFYYTNIGESLRSRGQFLTAVNKQNIEFPSDLCMIWASVKAAKTAKMWILLGQLPPCWRQERAMDRMDRPRTSIDERMLSEHHAVMIV